MSETAGRFMGNVQKQDSGCWHWLRSLSGNGYGRFSAGGSRDFAHRWAYRLFVGAIPSGLVIDHLCRNRACVNPTHLEAVTTRENNRRGDGLAGARSRQTHCLRGHAFDAENTVIRSNGCRRCRTCDNTSRRLARTPLPCRACGADVAQPTTGRTKHHCDIHCWRKARS